MTDLKGEWSQLPRSVISATHGSRSISESCVGLQHVVAEFVVHGKLYQVRFGRKKEAAASPYDDPIAISWALAARRENDQVFWFVPALGQTLQTEGLALAISAKLTEYSLEYENEIAL